MHILATQDLLSRVAQLLCMPDISASLTIMNLMKEGDVLGDVTKPRVSPTALAEKYELFHQAVL